MVGVDVVDGVSVLVPERIQYQLCRVQSGLNGRYVPERISVQVTPNRRPNLIKFRILLPESLGRSGAVKIGIVFSSRGWILNDSTGGGVGGFKGPDEGNERLAGVMRRSGDVVERLLPHYISEGEECVDTAGRGVALNWTELEAYVSDEQSSRWRAY